MPADPLWCCGAVVAQDAAMGEFIFEKLFPEKTLQCVIAFIKHDLQTAAATAAAQDTGANDGRRTEAKIRHLRQHLAHKKDIRAALVGLVVEYLTRMPTMRFDILMQFTSMDMDNEPNQPPSVRPSFMQDLLDGQSLHGWSFIWSCSYSRYCAFTDNYDMRVPTNTSDSRPW